MLSCCYCKLIQYLMIVFNCFRKIRQKIITIFHIQLCIALFLMYLMFIIGILRVEHEVVCSIMSALIQYFALASVSWMGAEALLMLKTLVINVFYGPTKNFIIVTSVVCWGKCTVLASSSCMDKNIILGHIIP